ncbi:MAG: hypothetical protein NTX49_06950 [Chlamydiae bacterium]|nr:hypothetical protein [Chlamydiota bacterium]
MSTLSSIRGGVPSVSDPETDNKIFTAEAVAQAVPHCKDSMSSAGGCGDSAYRDHPFAAGSSATDLPPLASFDEILNAIRNDNKYLLNNPSLTEMFRRSGIEATEEKLAACYDLAYKVKNPYIYRPSPTPPALSNYTINFLWVNLNPQDRIADVAQNIFKNGLDLSENAECIKDPRALRELEATEATLEGEALTNWTQIKKSFAYRISKWADAVPGAQINLWYDSALVTEKARHGTFEMMRAMATSRGVDLQLRDVRQLPSLTGELENSLHPGTPVYYRVDLLKVLITDYMMSSPRESSKYCVVSDIDIEPMSTEHMFDKRTLDFLSSDGYVFNGGNENSFLIFNREKEGLQETHSEIMIKPIIETLTDLRTHEIREPPFSEAIPGSQFVYKYYFYLRNAIGVSRNAFGRGAGKVVKCPMSQFYGGGSFSTSDHQKETFRFKGTSNVPYTNWGRNNQPHTFSPEESPIDALKSWRAEPLRPAS